MLIFRSILKLVVFGELGGLKGVVVYITRGSGAYHEPSVPYLRSVSLALLSAETNYPREITVGLIAHIIHTPSGALIPLLSLRLAAKTYASRGMLKFPFVR
jgi:hypothetical protein